MNKEEFLQLAKKGKLEEGTKVTIIETKVYTVTTVQEGRVRMDRDVRGGTEMLSLDSKPGSKVLEDAVFEVEESRKKKFFKGLFEFASEMI